MSIPNRYTNKVPPKRNGPKGNISDFFTYIEYKENGNAITLPTKIANKALDIPRTLAIKNISLISPPPKVSFPKILLHISINNKRIPTKTKPDTKYIKALSSGRKIKLSRVISIEHTRVTSSGIIIYLPSDTITIIKYEDISIEVSVFGVRPKTKYDTKNKIPVNNSIHG